MHRNYVITPEQGRLQVYRKALKEELRDVLLSEGEFKRMPLMHPRILEYKGRILGGRSRVSHFADWTEFLIREYGPQQSCLSLGSGIGRVERYLIQIGFARRFEAIDLNPRHNIMVRRANAHIAAREGDLNFVEVKPNRYDFILCHGILHHLINLEHVLEQINHGLKPDGLLLIHEYVGEDRWQFSETRLSWLNKMLEDAKLKNPPLSRVHGFEAVRSGDLLALVQAQFGSVCERSVNYGGVFFPSMVCNPRIANQRIEQILELDEEVSQQGELPPCYHMGVYHKSDAAPPQAVPWTDEQLKAKLSPPMSVPQRLVRIGHGVRSKVRLRTHLRRLLSHLRPRVSQAGPGTNAGVIPK